MRREAASRACSGADTDADAAGNKRRRDGSRFAGLRADGGFKDAKVHIPVHRRRHEPRSDQRGAGA